MDIAFVSNVVYPYVTGGAEKRIHEIGSRLAADGHDVTVYGRHFWDGPELIEDDGMVLRAVAPGTDLYVDDRRSISEAIDFGVRLAYPLARQLRDGDHDVVVASVFPYFPVLSAALARVGTGTPLVTTWHEVWRDHWDDYLDTLAPCGKLVERLTAAVPQHPVAVSGVTADRLSTLGPDRSTVDVVPNGIDMGAIRSAPLPVDRGETAYDVLFAGRHIPEKNVNTLLAAFDRVAGQYDVTLGIIGEGPRTDTLRTRAKALDNADAVSFLGFLDEYEAVLGHMRAATVFASPSTREGFGIAYAEAMAADCTVIAADHPESAAGELVGDAGFVVDPSVDAVTAALERALDGERPPTEPTARASEYDWDTIAHDALSAYERAVNGEW